MSKEQIETFEKSKVSESDLLRQINDPEPVSIDILNENCFQRIFLYLPILEAIYMQQVCRKWMRIINEILSNRKRLDFKVSTWGTRRRSINVYHVDLVLRKYIGKYLEEIDMSGSMLNIEFKRYVILLLHIYNCTKNLKKCSLIDLYVDLSSIQVLQSISVNLTNFVYYPSAYIGELDECDNALYAFFKYTKRLECCEIYSHCLPGKYLLALPKETIHTLKIRTDDRDIEIYLCKALQKLRNLKFCMLHLTNISSRMFEVLALRCANLEIFTIYTRSWNTIPPDFFFWNFQNLHTLDIGLLISNELLDTLAKQCQQIVDLYLANCFNVTEKGIAAIAKLPKLENLTLAMGEHITDTVFKPIHGLKELSCSNCAITNEGIITLIHSSPKLRVLSLLWCNNITADICLIIQNKFPNQHIDLTYL